MFDRSALQRSARLVGVTVLNAVGTGVMSVEPRATRHAYTVLAHMVHGRTYCILVPQYTQYGKAKEKMGPRPAIAFFPLQLYQHGSGFGVRGVATLPEALQALGCHKAALKSCPILVMNLKTLLTFHY